LWNGIRFGFGLKKRAHTGDYCGLALAGKKFTITAVHNFRVVKKVEASPEVDTDELKRDMLQEAQRLYP